MSIAKHHVEWMGLVEHQGPFLSLRVLMGAFPQGLDDDDSGLRAELRLAYQEWREAQSTQIDAAALHTAWVRFVLEEVLGFDKEVLRTESKIPDGVQVGDLRPNFAVLNPEGHEPEGKPRLLVVVHPPGTHLDGLRKSDALTTPTSELRTMLHRLEVRIGIVTNGEEWRVLSAEPGEPTGIASFYASVWLDEPLTFRAFQSLYSIDRFFGVAGDKTVEKLYEVSAEDTEEVTNQLGAQVRRSVEILVQNLDLIDAERGRALLADISEKRLYEAAVTVMMRLVFLLSAEERELLRLGDQIYDEGYAVSTLRQQLREVADQSGEEVLERRHDAWSRLLATFRAVYAGVQHEALQLRAYKGSLFDPDRFPFLEGRRHADEEGDPLPVNNRTVLHLLESVQLLEVKIGRGIAPEKRRLSFKALSVEQIGYVYEGLLDHTAQRADRTVLGLEGSKGKEPEIALDELEAALEKGPDAFGKAFKKQLGKADKSVAKTIAGEPEVEDQRMQRLRVMCGQDEELTRRVARFAAFLRDDTFGYPVVIREGSVYVTAGDDRRSTGTHYTPPQITEPIVKHTLDPVVFDGPSEGKPEDEWVLKSPKEILDLKVCDFAMGSGAFLVQAIRYLAHRLVEAWAKAQSQAGSDQLLITPEGAISRGHPSERPLPADHDERLLLARRAVASRCIYGVDKNPMAVELAKLSLWLETLEKNKPFTFLDHALKAGDSLFGITDPEQIRRLHWYPEKGVEQTDQGDLFQSLFQLPALLDRAAELRRQIESYTVEEERDADEKAELLRQADEALEEVRAVADALAAAAKQAGGKTDQRLTDGIYRHATDAQQAWSARIAKGLHETRGSERRATVFREISASARDVLNDDEHGPWTPFHWLVEFPEVFLEGASPGFEAVIGNPPFQGGQKLTGSLGEPYREWLVAYLADGTRGSADLCAYFFLRALRLLSGRGGFGLVATNTIAQGDTREVGLDRVVDAGAVVHRAVPSEKWPGSAALEVARCWVRRDGSRWSGPRVLSGQEVEGIGPYLVVPGTAVGKPYRLAANSGRSFQGSIVLGLGFTMPLEEAARLIERDPRNRDVLFPYLNGKDLNTHPEQKPSRWVINFFDWPLERAREYPECFAIVSRDVKPGRDALGSGNATARDRAKRWWQFARPTRALYKAIANLDRVLATTLVGKHLCFSFLPRDLVFSDRVGVIADDRASTLALLQSNIHGTWTWAQASTMRNDLCYTPTDCFETFPFPRDYGALEDIGQTYHQRRKEWMLREQVGLTGFYNHLHDPADKDDLVQSVRDLTVELDQKVLDLYGWSDLDLQHDFHETRLGTRFEPSESAKAELNNRLLQLNHDRYAEEQEAAGGPKKAGKRKKTSSPRKKKGASKKPSKPGSLSLFEEDAS
jgi:hypothetical protein